MKTYTVIVLKKTYVKVTVQVESRDLLVETAIEKFDEMEKAGTLPVRPDDIDYEVYDKAYTLLK